MQGKADSHKKYEKLQKNYIFFKFIHFKFLFSFKCVANDHVITVWKHWTMSMSMKTKKWTNYVHKNVK